METYDMHEHHHEDEGTPKEYLKFAAVLAAILAISYGLAVWHHPFEAMRFMRFLMAVFFLVFGLFKLLDLPGFVMSYIGYDLIASRSTAYAYAYPFVELALSLGYFLNLSWVNWLTLFFMTVGSIGVLRQLARGSKIKCACLGTYIKLPLTTVSLVEDLAMGVMALYFLVK
jgi:hypothetical protein